MRVTLLCVGKTDDDQVAAIMERFQLRLKHYVSFAVVIIPDLRDRKHLSVEQQKAKEAALLLKYLSPSDHVLLLDERGAMHRSVAFAQYMNKLLIAGLQHVVFVVGGPYGFDSSVYDRANGLLSLSKMTFSHQMVRLFFVEQLYRAFSILKGEPYHHE